MFTQFIAGALLLVAGVAVGVLWLKRRGGRNAAEVTIFSTRQELRSIGQLSVFKAVTKEIVTETDHSWGTFGKKYLSWVLSQKKMAMIFEFEIDFRFDLRRPEFNVRETGAAAYQLTLPPCQYEVH